MFTKSRVKLSKLATKSCPMFPNSRSMPAFMRAEKIVTDAAAELRNNVRGGGRNQEQIGALRDSDVFNGAFKIGFTARFSE